MNPPRPEEGPSEGQADVRALELSLLRLQVLSCWNTQRQRQALFDQRLRHDRIRFAIWITICVVSIVLVVTVATAAVWLLVQSATSEVLRSEAAVVLLGDTLGMCSVTWKIVIRGGMSASLPLSEDDPAPPYEVDDPTQKAA